jgi:hypothetical protein
LPWSFWRSGSSSQCGCWWFFLFKSCRMFEEQRPILQTTLVTAHQIPNFWRLIKRWKFASM